MQLEPILRFSPSSNRAATVIVFEHFSAENSVRGEESSHQGLEEKDAKLLQGATLLATTGYICSQPFLFCQ